MKTVVGFVLAVVVTSVLGAVAHTQFVLAGLERIGAPIDISIRLQATWHDVVGMLPAYGAVLIVAYLVAIPVAALIVRRVPHLRAVGYALACAVAVVALIVVSRQLAGISGIAGARTGVGILVQGLAGAVGGYVFAMVSLRR